MNSQAVKQWKNQAYSVKLLLIYTAEKRFSETAHEQDQPLIPVIQPYTYTQDKGLRRAVIVACFYKI